MVPSVTAAQSRTTTDHDCSCKHVSMMHFAEGIPYSVGVCTQLRQPLFSDKACRAARLAVSPTVGQTSLATLTVHT
jgi:hypothetical protein